MAFRCVTGSLSKMPPQPRSDSNPRGIKKGSLLQSMCHLSLLCVPVFSLGASCTDLSYYAHMNSSGAVQPSVRNCALCAQNNV